MQIRVDGRDVGLGMVRIGVEGDHGVADIVFEGLPEMDAPIVTLHWTTGTAGDIVALEQTVQGWQFEITSTLTQYGGAQISAYLQMVSGEQRWHSNAFVLRVNDLPGVDATVTPPSPTVIDQLIAMVQQGRQEVADALIELGEGVEAVGQALVEVEALADRVGEAAQGVAADRDATRGFVERAETAAEDAEDSATAADVALDKLTNLTASAETLPPGSDATVAKTTTPDGYALAFGIPRGDNGDKGDKGDKGDTGAKGDKGDPGEVTQAELDAVTSQLAHIANQQAALEDDFDTAVAAVTVDSEVVLARRDETTLGNRIDKIDDEVEATLFPSEELTNLCVDGNFSALTGWTANMNSATPAIENNILTVTLAAGTIDPSWRIEQKVDSQIAGHIYYVSLQVNPLRNSKYTLVIGGASSAYIDATGGTWTSIKARLTAVANTRARFYINLSSYSAGETIQYKYVNIIDLTAEFGAGNEPSLADMDFWMTKHNANKFLVGTQKVRKYNTATKLAGSVNAFKGLYDVTQFTSHLYGKKLVCFGDSITGKVYSANEYPPLIASRTGMTVYNVGFGGSRAGVHITNYDPFSFYKLVDCIVAGDYSSLKVAFEGRPSDYAVRVATLETIDFTTVDYITLLYGTNDWGANTPDEGATSEDATSFRGALRKGLTTLLTAYPQLKVLLISPIYRWYPTHEPINDSDTETISGDYLYEFVTATGAIATEFKFPFLDAYYTLGINKYTRLTYFDVADGTHPSDNGRILLGNKIADKLLAEY